MGAFQINPTYATVFSATGWGAGGWSGSTVGFPTTTGWGQSSSPSVATIPGVWSQANYGQNLIMNQTGLGIYYWVVGATGGYSRAQLLSPTNANTQDGVAYWQTDGGVTACPTIANMVLVSDQSRFVIGFGTDNNGDGDQDPMLISWSDQENATVWLPSPINQAGNYRLSLGSRITAVKQGLQQILVWTDSTLYSMQYVGAPFIWGFTPMATNISIAGQNTPVFANNSFFWMGTNCFYSFNGTVNTLPCSVREYVFNDINLAQAGTFFGGVNAGYSEIWWFYCSADSNTIDSYVIYNYMDNTWAYGSMARTAWLYSALRQFPMATGYASDGNNGNLLYHENGLDNGQTIPTTPITAFVQSADVDIGDGDKYAFGWRLIPDVSFNYSTSSAPEVNMTIYPRQNPGSPYNPGNTPPDVVSNVSYATTQYYTVQQFTEQINVRVRGRQMAFRVESNTLGTQWQLGTVRMDIRADGGRA